MKCFFFFREREYFSRFKEKFPSGTQMSERMRVRVFEERSARLKENADRETANEERGTKFTTTGTAATGKLKRCPRGLGGMTPRIVL